MLKKFSEPAWNYQVVRYLDDEGKDILPRKDRVWTLPGTVLRTEEALQKVKQKTPRSLELLKMEIDTGNHRQIALAMYCFWTGEMRLGAIDGVVKTEAGWLDGREVTLVTYHKGVISLSDLLKKAGQIDCAHKVYLKTDAEKAVAVKAGKFSLGRLDKSYRAAKSSDQKKQIQGTPYAKIKNLSLIQETKVNAFARSHQKLANQYLTRQQLQTLLK